MKQYFKKQIIKNNKSGVDNSVRGWIHILNENPKEITLKITFPSARHMAFTRNHIIEKKFNSIKNKLLGVIRAV